MKAIVIVGYSGSGKTTVVKELGRSYGIEKIVTYTTRPMRAGEVDGVDYHFVTDAEFERLKAEGFFAETTSFHAIWGYCQYGTAKEDLRFTNKCIILNPHGLKEVKRQGLDVTAIYLRASEDVLRERLVNRGDEESEIVRRLPADESDFKDILEYVDYVIDVSNLSVSQVAKEIIRACV